MTALEQKRILIVEDDELCANSLKRLLEVEGFEVRTEPRGRVVLETTTAFKPDLIILDLKLPDVHGYEVCQAIRKRFHSWVMPILMFTGMDKPVDQLRGFAYGADAYLTKPCPATELVKTVRLLLGEMSLTR